MLCVKLESYHVTEVMRHENDSVTCHVDMKNLNIFLN